MCGRNADSKAKRAEAEATAAGVEGAVGVPVCAVPQLCVPGATSLV